VDVFWKSWLLVPLGGAIGATLRHSVNLLTVRLVGLEWSHLATLAVNAIGCLLMGGLMQVAEERSALPESVRWLVVTGLLGSLTTFSAFGHETMEFVRDGKPATAVMNVALNLAVGLSAVAVGWWMARQFGTAA
jgi:fluoride exporter